MKAQDLYKIGKVVTVTGASYRNGKKFSGFVVGARDHMLTVSTNNRRSTVFVDLREATVV